MRARLKLFVKIFDWLSWFPCTWTTRDHHRPLSWCKHMVIWPLTWLVELWKVPRKTPLLAYINQELRTIKRNSLDRTPVTSDCVSLAEGLGWRTAGSLFLGVPQLYWGKFHCLSLSEERPPQSWWPRLSIVINGTNALMLLSWRDGASVPSSWTWVGFGLLPQRESGRSDSQVR